METHIDRARARVAAEREAADAKVEAFDAFVARVTNVPVESTPASPPGVTSTAGARMRGTASTPDRRRDVRSAFAETVSPCVTEADGSDTVLATIRDEFTESLAFALAPTTEATFSPQLKRMTVESARTRRAEAALLGQVLSEERAQLDAARDLVDEVTAWLADANEQPLTDLGFETLQQRHETLARYRRRCVERLERRQSFCQRTTNETVDVGIRHRSLVASLYEDFPTAHPVLSTVVRLDELCATCQKTVRDHLVRRA